MATSLVYRLTYGIDVQKERASAERSRTFHTPPWKAPQDAYNLLALDTDRDISTLVDRTGFRYVLNTHSCQGLEDLLLLVFIHSAPSHSDKRIAIRETWGNASALRAATGEQMVLVFMVGIANATQLQERLMAEAERYTDMVMGNFLDTYRNLTYKHAMGLKWVTYFCRNAQYVLKADDDVFLDLFRMAPYLRKDFGSLAPPNLMLCPMVRRPLVKRSYRSKWRMSFREYAGYYYPPYCMGWCVVMSPDVVFNLYRATAGLRYFRVDDVFFTGILAKRIGLSHVDFSDRLPPQQHEALARLDHIARGGDLAPLLGLPNLHVGLIYMLFNRTKRHGLRDVQSLSSLQLPDDLKAAPV